MAGAPLPGQQLDELRRVRAVVEERLRSPWWIYLLMGTTAGAALPLSFLLPRPWGHVALLGFALVSSTAGSWVSRRRA